MTAAVVPDGTRQLRLNRVLEARNYEQDVVIGSAQSVTISPACQVRGRITQFRPDLPATRLRDIPGEHPVDAMRAGGEIQAWALAEDLSRTVASFEAAARKLGLV